jgi:hypothetical protein
VFIVKVGVMQPYFIPYIGYWQLINAVDKYVIFDDVNYINRGWINRNRILVNGKNQYYNILMHDASQNKLINEIKLIKETKELDKSLQTLRMAYKNAPYFNETFPIIEKIILYYENNLALFLENSIKELSRYLGISTEFIRSSDVIKDNTLKGQDKILAICKKLKADQYINAIGGQELYSYEKFSMEGIQLAFLKTDDIYYKQFDNEFQKNLSIVDVLMFNPLNEVKIMLNQYQLISF